MGREEDRAARVAHLAHHALQDVRSLWVETDERLIHQNKLWLVQPRRDDGELLLHAVGVRRDGLGEVARQLEEARVLADALLPRPRLHVEDISNEIEVLDARHELVEVGVIWNVGEHFLAGDGIVLNGVSADRDLAGIELLDADDGLERCGLARAVVADEAVDLPGRDVKRQIIHGLLFTEGLGQMVDIEHKVLPLFFLQARQISL